MRLSQLNVELQELSRLANILMDEKPSLQLLWRKDLLGRQLIPDPWADDGLGRQLVADKECDLPSDVRTVIVTMFRSLEEEARKALDGRDGSPLAAVIDAGRREASHILGNFASGVHRLNQYASR
jgi:hypothetical protein